MHSFSWEILIAGQRKKTPKAVKKTQLYYSVHKRFLNEAGKELEKFYLAVVQIAVQRKDFSLKQAFLAVQLPLLSLKVQLGFFHPHCIYFIIKKENKQTKNQVLAFYSDKEKVLLEHFLFKKWFM